MITLAVELHGYQYSVYTRIARIVLAEKHVDYTRVEVDPFQDFVPEHYRAMHVTGSQFIVGEQLSLCDIHLAPMIACFAMTTEGAAALSEQRRLSRWWTHMQEYPSIARTDPGLPNPATKSP